MVQPMINDMKTNSGMPIISQKIPSTKIYFEDHEGVWLSVRTIHAGEK
jgi:hypothetical protein